jgi:hypothetical protein
VEAAAGEAIAYDGSTDGFVDGHKGQHTFV